jgi:8-oxo-dGTP pyrophosphatase MutT (NUDIX family)
VDAATSAARDALVALQQRGIQWWVSPGRPMFPVTPAARHAAVLVLFGVLDAVPAGGDAVAADLDVLLLRRAATLSTHAGQVAFPGGRIEPGEDATAAALREATEEVGLDVTGIEVLGTLPPAPLVVSDHLVTPVLGWWTKPSQVAAVDANETVDVFRIPVADLLEPANRWTVVANRARRPFPAPAFQVGDVIVWGFTAIVLSNLFDALGWAVPWDRGRELELGRGDR